MTDEIDDSPAVAATLDPGAGASVPSDAALLPGWRCIADAIIRADGEEGPIDLLALEPTRGAALIGFLEPGQEASSDEALAAFRIMLRELGFEERFPGELPALALAVPRAARPLLPRLLGRAFAPLPQPSLPEGWIEWLAERVGPDAARSEPLPEIAATPPHPSVSVPRPVRAPPLLESVGARSSWLDWGASLGFAVGILLALLLGLAAVSRGGRLF